MIPRTHLRLCDDRPADRLTNEVLKVATTVGDAEVAIPAGFKESK